MIPLEVMSARHGVKPSGILHLGAHTGQEASIYAGWKVPRVAWVEANPALIPLLRRHVGGLPGHTVHEAAILDEDGKETPLYLASNGGSTSLLPMKLHARRYPEVLVSGTIMVRTSTVDTLMRRDGLDAEHYDFMNMDLQGAEGRAIAGMKKQLAHLRWIYTEVNFEELYEGCLLFDDLRRLLESRGFKLLEFSVEGEGWGEALFRRA